MKKTLLLIIAAMISLSLIYAQSAKDPQEDLRKVQQTLKSVQNTNAQLKYQLNEQKKIIAGLGENLSGIQNAGKGRDSVVSAINDSLRVVSAQSLETKDKVSKARMFLSFFQVVVIICLLLIIVVLFLMLKLKKELRKMREKMESNRDRLDNRITQVASSLDENMKQLREEGVQRNALAEKKILEIRDSLQGEIQRNKEQANGSLTELSKGVNQQVDELRKSAESRFSDISQQVSDLDNKEKTALGAVKTEFQNAIRDVKSAIDKVSSSVQSIAKHPKHSGNSAE